VRLVAALAMWAWQCDQVEVLAWALETALDVSVTDPELAAYAFAAATITRSRSNELFEGADTAQRAAIATQSTGGVAAALSFYAAAEVGLFRGEFSSAEQSALRAYSFGVAAGDAPGARAATFFAAIDAALAIIYSGRSAEAGIWIETAHRLAIELDSAGARAWVELTRADAAFSSGDIDRALEHMNRCVALIDGSQHSFLAGVADLSLAELASAQNRLKPGTVRRDLLLSFFERWQTTMSWAQATTGLRVLAAALAAEGQSLNAAVILGAFFASAVDPSDTRVQTDGTLSRLSADLSDGELQRLLAQGGAMSLHDAVQHAIEILTDSLPN
jgi:tetratricopeptide (TPR) repeat protein